MSADLPTDPNAIKKMEKAMAKEAKADEKDYKRILKQLKHSEQSEAKASKAASNADKHLKKMEEKEHRSIKSLQKATQGHDRAVTNRHTALTDLQMQRIQAERFKRNAESLRVKVDRLFKSKQAREEKRSHKQADLHSPR
ncbi:hypothetical protein JVU11DRAFT_1356 [Chiua virens]|nr:hypothetical protein JVU11DRAFT_1356 [Chiua virens]